MKNRGDEMTETTNAQRSYWFVGASYGGTEDQTSRFLSEGIWENGYDDKYLDLGVCQTSCPPISCGVSGFRGAGVALGIEPDWSDGLPVAGFA